MRFFLTLASLLALSVPAVSAEFYPHDPECHTLDVEIPALLADNPGAVETDRAEDGTYSVLQLDGTIMAVIVNPDTSCVVGYVYLNDDEYRELVGVKV